MTSYITRRSSSSSSRYLNAVEKMLDDSISDSDTEYSSDEDELLPNIIVNKGLRQSHRRGSTSMDITHSGNFAKKGDRASMTMMPFNKDDKKSSTGKNNQKRSYCKTNTEYNDVEHGQEQWKKYEGILSPRIATVAKGRATISTRSLSKNTLNILLSDLEDCYTDSTNKKTVQQLGLCRSSNGMDCMNTCRRRGLNKDDHPNHNNDRSNRTSKTAIICENKVCTTKLEQTKSPETLQSKAIQSISPLSRETLRTILSDLGESSNHSDKTKKEVKNASYRSSTSVAGMNKRKSKGRNEDASNENGNSMVGIGNSKCIRDSGDRSSSEDKETTDAQRGIPMGCTGHTEDIKVTKIVKKSVSETHLQPQDFQLHSPRMLPAASKRHVSTPSPSRKTLNVLMDELHHSNHSACLDNTRRRSSRRLSMGLVGIGAGNKNTIGCQYSCCNSDIDLQHFPTRACATKLVSNKTGFSPSPCLKKHCCMSSKQNYESRRSLPSKTLSDFLGQLPLTDSVSPRKAKSTSPCEGQISHSMSLSQLSTINDNNGRIKKTHSKDFSASLSNIDDNFDVISVNEEQRSISARKLSGSNSMSHLSSMKESTNVKNGSSKKSRTKDVFASLSNTDDHFDGTLVNDLQRSVSARSLCCSNSMSHLSSMKESTNDKNGPRKKTHKKDFSASLSNIDDNFGVTLVHDLQRSASARKLCDSNSMGDLSSIRASNHHSKSREQKEGSCHVSNFKCDISSNDQRTSKGGACVKQTKSSEIFLQLQITQPQTSAEIGSSSSILSDGPESCEGSSSSGNKEEKGLSLAIQRYQRPPLASASP